MFCWQILSNNTHNRHPITRPWGRVMGCVLWVPSLTEVLHLLSQCWCKKNIVRYTAHTIISWPIISYHVIKRPQFTSFIHYIPHHQTKKSTNSIIFSILEVKHNEITIWSFTIKLPLFGFNHPGNVSLLNLMRHPVAATSNECDKGLNIHTSYWVNTLRPRQNGHLFADDIFKCIFLNENVWIAIKISLTFVPKGLINNIPALVQIMAWRRLGDKPLSEAMIVR